MSLCLRGWESQVDMLVKADKNEEQWERGGCDGNGGTEKRW